MTYTIEPMGQNYHPGYHRVVKRDVFGRTLYRSKPLQVNELVALEDALRVHRLGLVRYDPTSAAAYGIPNALRMWIDGEPWCNEAMHGERFKCVDDADTWADGRLKRHKNDEWCWTTAHDGLRYAWYCVDTTSPRCSPLRTIPADLTCAA